MRQLFRIRWWSHKTEPNDWMILLCATIRCIYTAECVSQQLFSRYIHSMLGIHIYGVPAYNRLSYVCGVKSRTHYDPQQRSHYTMLWETIFLTNMRFIRILSFVLHKYLLSCGPESSFRDDCSVFRIEPFWMNEKLKKKIRIFGQSNSNVPKTNQSAMHLQQLLLLLLRFSNSVSQLYSVVPKLLLLSIYSWIHTHLLRTRTYHLPRGMRQ